MTRDGVPYQKNKHMLMRIDNSKKEDYGSNHENPTTCSMK